LLAQGSIVAHGLKDYLFRHPEMETMLSKHSNRDFLTTDSAEQFDQQASLFFGREVNSKHLSL
jgi:glutamate racemase